MFIDIDTFINNAISIFEIIKRADTSDIQKIFKASDLNNNGY